VSFLVNLIYNKLGQFKYADYDDSDVVLGPIFFYLYIIFFNLILSNIFIGIIERAYHKIKEETKSIYEVWDYKKVYLFCCFKDKKVKVDKSDVLDNMFDSDKKFLVRILT